MKLTACLFPQQSGQLPGFFVFRGMTNQRSVFLIEATEESATPEPKLRVEGGSTDLIALITRYQARLGRAGGAHVISVDTDCGPRISNWPPQPRFVSAAQILNR